MKRARRSILFVPADSERFVSKAEAASELDAVILDLEDGVSPDKKNAAKAYLPQAIERLQKTNKDVFLRVNALDTHQGIQDLMDVFDLGMDAIVLPKILPATLVMADRMLAVLEASRGLKEGTVRLLLMIETAAAIQQLEQLLNSTQRVDALIFGAEDYSNDLGVNKHQAKANIRFAQTMIVNAACAHQVDAIDSPCTDFKNSEVYTEEIRYARVTGFTGKATIHPCMIEVINREFTPSQEELEYARGVVSAFEEGLRQQKGAVSFEGKMIDLPVAERARKLLARNM